MRLNSRRNTGITIAWVITIFTTGWTSSLTHAADNASKIVTVKANVRTLTCALTMPSQVFLGSILQGEQRYQPFSVRIDCQTTSTNTTLYAKLIGGNLTNGSTTRVDMTGPTATGTPAQMWLTTEGKDITLDGSGATNVDKGFCSGVTDRTCTLTPSTLVDATTPLGETVTTIQFNISYP